MKTSFILLAVCLASTTLALRYHDDRENDISKENLIRLLEAEFDDDSDEENGEENLFDDDDQEDIEIDNENSLDVTIVDPVKELSNAVADNSNTTLAPTTSSTSTRTLKPVTPRTRRRCFEVCYRNFRVRKQKCKKICIPEIHPIRTIRRQRIWRRLRFDRNRYGSRQ